jgi:Fe-S cluster biogenesis protein NfuA
MECAMYKRVEEIIENKVKPILAQHHGSIELVSVEANTIEVKLLGACSGCPSAKATLEDTVLGLIQEDIPSMEEVVLVTEVSEDLLSMARTILTGKKL